MSALRNWLRKINTTNIPIELRVTSDPNEATRCIQHQSTIRYIIILNVNDLHSVLGMYYAIAHEYGHAFMHYYGHHQEYGTHDLEMICDRIAAFYLADVTPAPYKVVHEFFVKFHAKLPSAYFHDNITHPSGEKRVAYVKGEAVKSTFNLDNFEAVLL